MKRENLYLGVDVGTSSIKLILIDDAFKILKQESGAYELDNPVEGYLEIDPEKWIEAFLEAADRLLCDVDRRSIKRIGVTGQMHTLVLLGEEGKVLRPAIMWNDLRTKDMLPELKKDISSFDDGAYLSRIISTGSPLSNLLWVKKREPEIFKAIRNFQIGWDYVTYRLTGKHYTDYCNASTSCLYNLSGRRWSEEIRRYVGLSADCYPEVRGSMELAGNLTGEFQDRLGLLEQTEVIVGTGDNPATVISTGGLWKKDPVFSFGTSGVFTRIFPGEQGAYNGKKIMFAFHRDETLMLEQGVVQSCGKTYDWWNRQFGNRGNTMELEKEIDLSQEVNKPLLFYPHLAGDKTIYSDPELRGMFVGIDTRTDKKAMQYAVLEGICFSVKELIETMDIHSEMKEVLRVVGGGTENELWMQILSNILNVRVDTMNGNSGAVYGVGFLAAKQDHLEEMEELINKNTRIKRSYIPDRNYQKQYQKKYACYLRMRDVMHYIYGNKALKDGGAEYEI